MASFDSIVIGAGHNGLVCATMLARAGQRVLLLESAKSIGGLAANREFHSGFKAPVAHHVRYFRRAVIKELNLESHGLEISSVEPSLIALGADENHVVLRGNKVEGVDEDDALAFEGFHKSMQGFADALAPFWLKTMPRIAPGTIRDKLTFAHLGLNLRRLGKAQMREFLRVFSLPMRDLMDENFKSDLLKSLLSWDGLVGSKMAPRSPNNSVLTMLYRMGGTAHISSVASLINALQAASTAAGVEIRTDASVESIEIKGDASGLRATGVRLRGGEVIEAGRIVSSADPKTTFIGLIGVNNLEIGFTNRIRRLRCAGHVAKLHLALESPPDFRGVDSPDRRMILAPTLDAIEFAYDDAKYGGWSGNPVMEITVPSTHDPSLAPSGQHVLSAHVMYVPHSPRGGWSEDARTGLSEAVIARIDQYAPGIRDTIIGQELLTPADLERDYGVSGGHWHHAEMALDQMLMMRPTYEAAQYATPIPGAYLCGAGCHPGGDLTGAPGYNAARAILK